MDFGLMFFSSAGAGRQDGKYELLCEAARVADRLGFAAVWTPERHFHEFGGLFPNPAITSTALAMITEHVDLRAGSLISPLHDPLRIVEEWSVVDNLSHGRIGVSFGSGWNADDFAFYPENYSNRREIVFEHIALIRDLWRGAAMTRVNGAGVSANLRPLPTPISPELPVWVTSSGSTDTCVRAGEVGANLLTHLLGQEFDDLNRNVCAYRDARERAGHEGPGCVTLMLHTFIAEAVPAAFATVRVPFRDYIRSAVSLERLAADGGGVISGGRSLQPGAVQDEGLVEELLDLAFERYANDAALFGTPQSCMPLLQRLAAIGVNEIACLVDFGVSNELVLESVVLLDQLRRHALTLNYTPSPATLALSDS